MGQLGIVGNLLIFASGFFTGGTSWALLAGGVALTAIDARRERKQARTRLNDSLEDRLTMIDVVADAPRTICLGRMRNVEGIRRRWSSGTNAEKLTMIVSVAGHEIDGFEQWYLDDTPVALDGNGWVITEPWGRNERSQRGDQVTLDGSGGGTFTITAIPETTGSVSAQWFEQINSTDANTGSCTVVSVTGTSVVLSGGQAGAQAWITYDVISATKYARIRPYLGTASQNVGGDIAAEYPGKITAADKFAGIACAVVDFTYSPDVFPQGYPSVSAVFRGAKVLNPATSVTEWTENPALHAYHYARHANGWALGTPQIRTEDIIAAATACAVSTGFAVTLTGGGTTTVTLPRYRCGMVIPTDADHREVMDSIVETMAGAWGWAGGMFRLRAGTLGTTALTITEDWLVSDTDGGGGVSDEAVITGVQSIPREQRINRVTGSCVDPAQRYQVLPFPAVEDAVLVAAKGARPMEVTFDGVNHIAHAQHLAKIAIRSAQAGLRMEMTCGVQALTAELFDVASVTLPDYGMTAKTCEVIGWTWSPTQAIRMRLAEITADIYVPTDTLTGRDPAPDSSLRAPWEVDGITGLAVTSGTTALSDGSVLTRAGVTWAAATGANIRTGGTIEVQYREATAPTSTEWASWIEQGASVEAIIPGLKAGRFYLFRVRAVQNLPLVRGNWSASALHQVAEISLNGIGAIGVFGSGNLCVNGGFTQYAAGLPTGFMLYSPGSGQSNTIELGTSAISGGNTWVMVNGISTVTNAFGPQMGWSFSSAAASFGGFKAGRSYIVSFYAAGNASVGSNIYTMQAAFNTPPAALTWLQNPALLNGVWSRYVARIEWGASVDPNGIFVGIAQDCPASFAVAYSCVQVEQGDVPSGWSPPSVTTLNMINGGNIGSYVGGNAFTEIVALTGETASASYARGSNPLQDPAKIVVLEQISWANTTGAAVTLELSISCVADQSVIGTGGSVRLRLDAGSSAFSDYTTADGDQITGQVITTDTQFSATKSYTVANGATAYVALNASLNAASSSTQSVNTYNTEMRITAVKR